MTELSYQPELVKFLGFAATGKLTQPLLIVGPEGTGKRLGVDNLVRKLVCQGSKQSVCDCYGCFMLKTNKHPDVISIILDGKVIGVEAIREMIDAVETYPSVAPCKVIVIDGADKMSVAAANAILKVLEEPPSVVRFYLISSKERSVLNTIRSRCCVVRAFPLPEKFIYEELKKHEKDDQVALLYTRLSQGSLGLALTYWGSKMVVQRDKVFTLIKQVLVGDILAVYESLNVLENQSDLVLRFCTLILGDIILLGRGLSNSLVNCDRRDDIVALKKHVDKATTLLAELDNLTALVDKMAINVQFHLVSIMSSWCLL